MEQPVRASTPNHPIYEYAPESVAFLPTRHKEPRWLNLRIANERAFLPKYEVVKLRNALTKWLES